MNNRYCFPLCIQLAPPEDLFENREFQKVLELLQDKGFYGVELNITDFDGIDPLKLKEYLRSYGLKMTYIASGVFAKKNGLSLSAADETVRCRTIAAFEKMVRFAEQMECGIICGFIKGGANEDYDTAAGQMKKSIEEVQEKFGDCPVRILLEATNHYEATLINTLKDAALLTTENNRNIDVLPDTYHMNIEESNTAAALVQYAKYYGNIHVSDNNRYFPGFGAIDFFHILSLLKGMGYHGTMAIEGRNKNSLMEDIAISAAYLEEISSRIVF